MEEEGCKSNASLLIASCLPACSHDLTLADEMLVMEKTQDQGGAMLCRIRDQSIVAQGIPSL
jgi:hypothetical protein